MTETRKDIDIRRLGALLDAYGADPARWPADERAAARALLAADPVAQARLDAARRLDRALDALPPAAPAGDLAARIRAAARRSAVPTPPTIPAAATPVPANGNRASWRFTAALAASAVIGLWLGFAAGPFTASDSAAIDLAALDQQDVAVLAFGPLTAGQTGTGEMSND